MISLSSTTPKAPEWGRPPIFLSIFFSSPNATPTESCMIPAQTGLGVYTDGM